MNYLKFLGPAILFIVLCAFFFPVPKVYAAGNSFVTIVNPIRGHDFWEHNFDILATPKKQYNIITTNNLPATWLVRYDALLDPQVIQFLKSLGANQEIGLFLEITPSLAKDAGVHYNQSPNWHYAQSILLTGYQPSDREKLIDQAIKTYQDIFGRYPKSVGAWWIDAYSLDYLHQHYDVETNLDVADQYSTDQYQVWGQYFSTPFYPSKTNALLPAGSVDKKNGVVTIQWAARDPYNSYGNGVSDSTYSVQANDYLLHNLDINYFSKIIDIYPQVTVGLENDFDWQTYGGEYTKQVQLLSQKQHDGKLVVTSMEGFAKDYKNSYPGISPSVLISANDPLGGDGKVVWYQNSKYRVGWFYQPGVGSQIRDLRVYDEGSKEDCFDIPCQSLNMAAGAINALDDVTFGDRWIIDEGKITQLQVANDSSGPEISYINQAGDARKIKFLPNDIDVNGKVQTIASAIASAKTNSQTVNQVKIDRNSNLQFDFNKNIPKILVNFLKFLFLSILFFFLPGWLITKKLIFAIPVGWTVFTLSAYILGYLKVEFLLWTIPAIAILLTFKLGLPKFAPPKLTTKNLTVTVLIILGSLSWLLTTIKNGLFYGYGLGYWGPNGHDGIWHLSLISELQRNIPPQNPVFAGESLNNYHYFFDLLLAQSGKILGIDNQELLFRLFPLCISLFLGLILFKVIQRISLQLKKDNPVLACRAGILGLFFLYFGGSWGWIITFLQTKTLGGETLFWVQQAISTLLNPPFAISLVLLLTGYWFFLDFWETKNYKWVLPIIFCWGSLIEFKAYAGVLVLGSLGILAVEKIVLKRDFRLFLLTILCGVFAAAVFLPNNLKSEGLFIYSPFWLVYSMIDFSDRLGWERLSLALHSASLSKEMISLFVGVGIFILGNMGLRITALFQSKILIKQRFFLYISILGFLLSLFFIQKGTNWNIVQFFYYAVFVFNIFAALSLAFLWDKWGRKFIIPLIIIVVLTLPTTVITLDQYLPSRPPAELSIAEYQSLQFLKEQPVRVQSWFCLLIQNQKKSLQSRYPFLLTPRQLMFRLFLTILLF
ncbi:MAG: hypothetical protein M1142_06825 [Patescibacteria group bacterium]|nr:hypothetical protein [Patescibacteria group bacterium]